ncbi:bifunctional 3'-5' exonuclease/ATP-dependent helicase WRN-like [Saccostrea echinata]|uniref:bifunctional 3'-5' exonuclease/ATP-dependent helicase WRN-like n=1 Tax=Saccostrea echinata TaxID=191078 RepID=UPI002A82AB74|nr:bifunctional 3'-5' exonuclease/ATP-dependent helicase WRN-like [Saccostrea echinata]
MAWMIDGLDSFPRTIIYCTSIRDVSKLYHYLTSEVPDCVSFCDMFHSETPDSKKKKILDDLCNENGSLRIVIATSALGMGIDMASANNVILYGAPKQLVEVIQEIGRVGRDGTPALALLLYNSYHLRKAEQEVRDVYISQTCRRKVLLKPFVKENELGLISQDPHHTCCDRCVLLCRCNDCQKDVFLLEKMLKDEPPASESDTNSESTELYDDDVELLMESDIELE